MGAMVGKGHRSILDRARAFRYQLNFHNMNLDLDIGSVQPPRYALILLELAN